MNSNKKKTVLFFNLIWWLFIVLTLTFISRFTSLGEISPSDQYVSTFLLILLSVSFGQIPLYWFILRLLSSGKSYIIKHIIMMPFLILIGTWFFILVVMAIQASALHD